MRIKTNCSEIQGFCQALDKSLSDSQFTHLVVKGRQLTIHSQTSLGTVYYSTPVQVDGEFSAGVFSKNFIDTFKRMYGEEVDIVFNDKNLVIQKDNIKVSLPKVEKASEFHIPRRKLLECDSGILSEHLIKSVEVLDKTGYTKNPCVFVDNSKEFGTYICRFSDWAFRIAKMDKISADFSLLCVPDSLVKVLKAFKGKSCNFIYSKNKIGCEFENNVVVFLSQLSANMPIQDLFVFGVDRDMQSTTEKITFDRNALYMAVDTVSSILGDTEGFIEFEPAGVNSDGLVWEVRGKTSVGLQASEKVVSSPLERSEISGFGVSKKVLGKVLRNSNSEEVYLGDLSGSLLGIFIDDQVVYLMSKIHRG